MNYSLQPFLIVYEVNMTAYAVLFIYIKLI